MGKKAYTTRINQLGKELEAIQVHNSIEMLHIPICPTSKVHACVSCLTWLIFALFCVLLGRRIRR